jgi:hypothetical protein
MGRRRTKSLGLPKGVHQVRSKGRTYYYYRPGRGTSRATKPIKIFGDPVASIGTPDNERFWRELNHIVSQTVVFPSGSVRLLLTNIGATRPLSGCHPEAVLSTTFTLIDLPNQTFGAYCQQEI